MNDIAGSSAAAVNTGSNGASGASRPGTSDQPPAELTITDFLTDGSLAGLCAELSRLTGVGITLRDRRQRLIVQGEGRRAWEVRDDALPPGPGESVIPITVGGDAIGSLVLDAGDPRLADDARRHLEHVLALVSSASAELCEYGLEVRHRLRELTVIYRLTSLLARSTDVQQVLETALDAAIDVMELDAGAIMLLPEDADGIESESEADLTLAASRHLSRDWLESPLPLSKDRLFDKLALQGESVVVEDVTTDERVLVRERAKAEGLVSFINAGMVFQGRPLGVIRLYKRERRAFGEWDRRLLKSIGQQAAVAVHQARVLRRQEEERRVQRQLQLAADVQRRMLPRGVPSIPGIDVAASYQPSFELGGDFYDFIELHGHLGIAVGDVVGKGVAAALLMSSVRAALRAFAQDVYDLDEIISRVNVALARDTLDNEFATLWYGVLDPNSMRLTYSSGGHEPPMVVHVPAHRPPNMADLYELAVGGMAVGIDPSQRYQRGVVDLRQGDVLLAYTDGVMDATAFSGAKFGKARLRQTLVKILAENPQATAAQIVDSITWEIRRFAGLNIRPDDQTMVVLRVARKK